MQLSFVMIQGDHGARIDEVLRRAGHATTGRERCDVPGCLTWHQAAELVRSAPGPREVVRVTRDQGWTILSDESGRLSCAPDLWSAIARETGKQVLSFCADDELWAFSVHGPEGLRRMVVVDDEVLERGAPLPIESLFSGKATVEDLMSLVQSMGIDFERVNATASYRLVEVEAAA